VGFTATTERLRRHAYAVTLEGDLELIDAGRLKRLLFELIAGRAKLIEVDLRRVTLVDATAAGVLIIAERALQRQGGTLRLHGWGDDELERLLALNGETQSNGHGDDRPRLLFFHRRASGPTRRVDRFLGTVLQRTRAEGAFAVQRIAIEDHPDLAARFGVVSEPTLVVLEGNRPRARLANPRGPRELERVLTPWLRTCEPTAI
jgi:anti-anti-sigma factor